MNLQEATYRVTRIKQCSGDDEIAHTFEDELFHDFVKAIKNGKYETKKEMIEIATKVLESRDIEFTRHCA